MLEAENNILQLRGAPRKKSIEPHLLIIMLGEVRREKQWILLILQVQAYESYSIMRLYYLLNSSLHRPSE